MPTRGHIDYDQVREEARHGDADRFQMFTGDSNEGDVAKFDADGNLVAAAGDSVSAGRHTFGFTAAPVYVGLETVAVPIERDETILSARIVCKDQPPTGSDLILDIRRVRSGSPGSDVSIFGGGTKLVLPAGSAWTIAEQDVFDITDLLEGDLIYAVLDQVGSTFSGQDIAAVLKVAA